MSDQTSTPPQIEIPAGVHYPHVMRAFLGEPWAIVQSKLSAMSEAVAYFAAGNRYTQDEIAVRVGSRVPDVRRSGRAMVALDDGRGVFVQDDYERWSVSAPPPQGGGPGSMVAVLPILGVVRQRAAQLDSASETGTSTEAITSSLRELMRDDRVGRVVLDIDSPGGGVYGVEELADEIRAARDEKPIIAVANSLAASAAYWIASAASELVVTPSGEIGSIGVFMVHADFSKADEMAGVKFTLIKAGKYKAELNDMEPLSDEALVYEQSRIDDYYQAFLDGVGRGRNLTASQVRTDFGEGRVFGAREAVRRGMADRVGTLDATIAEAVQGARSGPRRTSTDQPIPSTSNDDEPRGMTPVRPSAEQLAAAIAGEYVRYTQEVS